MTLVWDHERMPHDDRLMTVLLEWNSTPYHLFSQVKGVGVDCVRFLCGVLDEMSGVDRDIDQLPPDVAFNHPRKARSAMRKILRLYDARPLEHHETAQSGDGFVVRNSNQGGPGHVLVYSSVPGRFYHATKRGIAKAGVRDVYQSFVGRFRMRDRSNW